VSEAVGGPEAQAPEIDIDRKVTFLGSTAAYGGRSVRVDRIETHFSWVFLTEKHVFKLKKPLRDNGLDFSSLASRWRNAEAEVRLNRRLAPDVYLGVVPLTLEGDRLALAGRGTVVDWLVQMVRLPADRMLDRCIFRSAWCPAEIHALGDHLAKFFATAWHPHIEPKAYLERFREECQASCRVLHQAGGPALRMMSGEVARRIESFVSHSTALSQRVEERRIVEGHGDLRPEHVCLGSPPKIIDCLEFRPDLRYLDPADELAFLGMECGRLGATGIGQILFYRYSRRTGDCPPPVLIPFYQAIGAMIRARIAMLHLLEFPVRDPEKWPKVATEYLAIAGHAVRRLDP
jgi:aminoglycoside phosphotransferase family enzyme